MNHIDSIELLDTGGGCLVDGIRLNNGMFIGISDELVCLYNSIEDFYEGEDAIQYFDVNLSYEQKTWPLAYIHTIEEYAGLDLVTLSNRDQVIISVGTITVAPSMFKLPQGAWVSMSHS